MNLLRESIATNLGITVSEVDGIVNGDRAGRGVGESYPDWVRSLPLSIDERDYLLDIDEPLTDPSEGWFVLCHDDQSEIVHCSESDAGGWILHTPAEWNSCGTADWEIDGDGQFTFQGSRRFPWRFRRMLDYRTLTFDEFQTLDMEKCEVDYRAFTLMCQRAHREYPEQTAEEVTESVYNDGAYTEGGENYGIDWEGCLLDASYQIGYECGFNAAKKELEAS